MRSLQGNLGFGLHGLTAVGIAGTTKTAVLCSELLLAAGFLSMGARALRWIHAPDTSCVVDFFGGALVALEEPLDNTNHTEANIPTVHEIPRVRPPRRASTSRLEAQADVRLQVLSASCTGNPLGVGCWLLAKM